MDWEKLYEEGLAWCSRGVKSLRVHGVNPFHVAMPKASRLANPKFKAVYMLEIFDLETNQWTESYYFEEEYEPCFKKFESSIQGHCAIKDPSRGFEYYGNPVSTRLWVMTGDAVGSAKTTWDELDRLDRNLLFWSCKHNSWML
jgi:hypothetical protein